MRAERNIMIVVCLTLLTFVSVAAFSPVASFGSRRCAQETANSPVLTSTDLFSSSEDFHDDMPDTSKSSVDDASFMASLSARMEEVSDRQTKLPVVVLDSILPRQVLKIKVENEVFVSMVKDLQDPRTDGQTFAMVGSGQFPDGTRRPLKTGAEIEIVGTPRLAESGSVQITLRAGRRIEISGEVENSAMGWTMARVSFISSSEQEKDEECGPDPLSLARAMSQARSFTLPTMDEVSLVDRWIGLARKNERESGQIDRLLEVLGPIPDDTSPTERALWIGALINPLPAMGVALEIRPALLNANTAEERVRIALDGLLGSVRHMDGTKPLW